MVRNINELFILNDSQFIDESFQSILGRASDPNGYRFYLDKISSGISREQVIYDIATSLEGKNFRSQLPGLSQFLIKFKIKRLFSLGYFLKADSSKKIDYLRGRVDYLDRELEYIRKNSSINVNAGQTIDGGNEHVEQSMIKQKQYIDHKVSQSNYLKSYFDSGAVANQLTDLSQIVFGKDKSKVLIYPVSYPLELRQRPDHLMRYFATNGYLCIAIVIDGSPPYVKERDGVYYTNLFAAVLSYFKDTETLLYLTYPFFSYLVSFLPKAIVLYDLLDDLSIFSNLCDEMISDHDRLLSQSAVITYSSKILYEKNRGKIQGSGFFVPNGVWIEDFNSVSANRKSSDSDKVITFGYYGAVSELLDWEFLNKLSLFRGVDLLLIGPLGGFDGFSSDQLRLKEIIFSRPNVKHIPLVDYEDLPKYLARFDAGLVPFVVNDKTNPVSPLKLYEYMAASLPVFATNTETLQGYRDLIYVADSGRLLKHIEDFVNEGALASVDYSKVISEFSWQAKLKDVSCFVSGLFKKHGSVEGKVVDIININFFDWDGVVVYKGGAERYVYDLAMMLKGKGATVRILQNANEFFEKDFQGVKVVGVKTNAGHDLARMSEFYRGFCENSDLIIASPLELACRLYGRNVIAINHGIYWDHKFRSIKSFNIAEHQNTFDSIWNSKSVVCVDTNFINWIRTFDYRSGCNLEFIPNYYDGEKFKFSNKEISRIKIIYPRRLYEARGIFITLDAFRLIFDRHPNVDLYLVGQANEDDSKIICDFVSEYKDRVTWDEFDMDDMSIAYRESHIALVPTMYSEGTSLSCLEAMATNHAIVATNVGGLPNLVIDGFNGFLVDPSVESLVLALEKLILNHDLLVKMAKNGGDLVGVFEKTNWEKKWDNVIKKALK